MTERHDKLIAKAIEQHSTIFPCADRTELTDCFTTVGNKILFWFNTADQSTHVLADESL
jgi:hypothetical protein